MVEAEEKEFIEVKTWRCPGEEGREESEEKRNDAEQSRRAPEAEDGRAVA